jgi:hypothetical protein
MSVMLLGAVTASTKNILKKRQQNKFEGGARRRRIFFVLLKIPEVKRKGDKHSLKVHEDESF